MLSIIALILSGFIYSQEFFIFSSSITSSNFRDAISDFPNVITNFKKTSFSPQFEFENLFIIQENITEDQIDNIEEEEYYGLGEFPNIFSFVEPQPINLGGDGKIKIKRKDTGEQYFLVYRNDDGSYNLEEIEKMKYIMRCSLDGTERKIPIRLVEILDAIQDKFGKNKEIILLSGYRSKPLNEITPGAAKNSLHLLGWAADIRIPGVSSKKIAVLARKLNIGGVGYYPRYGYVHIDIGKPRYWEKYQYSKKKNYAKKSKNQKKSKLIK